jgi:HAD superfamily hydrolase (TIGR01549 family)
MIKAIIFDYDGVMVDSFPVAWEVYSEIAKEIAHPKWTSGELKKVFLNPWNDNYDSWKLTQEQRKKCELIYRTKTIDLGKKVHIIPGVKETLTELKKHYRLILGSGTYKAIILPRLKELGINHLFEQIIGLEDHHAAKPDPKILNLCIEKLKLPKKEVIHIADMVSDIAMGRAAGVKTIIVPTYSWNAEEDIIKAQPDMLIKDLKELPIILKNGNN